MRKYGIIFVVETNDGQAYIGRIQAEHGMVTVYTGYQGRPPVIPIEEVDSMTPAVRHPDVEGL